MTRLVLSAAANQMARARLHAAAERARLPTMRPDAAPATAPVEKTVGKRARQALATLAELSRRWPAVFPPDGRARVVLTTGIHADIARMAPDIPLRRIDAALGAFTRRDTYLILAAKGGPRCGLDGQPQAELDASDRHHARTQLAERRSKRHNTSSGPPRSPPTSKVFSKNL